MANENTPAAPTHLPAEIQKKWQGEYEKALAAAQNDSPTDTKAQHRAALKAANRLLAVAAPKSAAEIDALESWQVLKRETRRGNRVCVTADGRKYSFPVPAAAEPAAPEAVELSSLTKAQLVDYAKENHDLQLNATDSKDKLIAAIEEARSAK